jgi:N-hydroxyarylamine O-acetyltransferase
MCHYHQTSPESPFTQKAICLLATTKGRVTLSNNRQIVTASGRREEWEKNSEEEYRTRLKIDFDIDPRDGQRIEMLMVDNTLSNSSFE